MTNLPGHHVLVYRIPLIWPEFRCSACFGNVSTAFSRVVTCSYQLLKSNHDEGEMSSSGSPLESLLSILTHPGVQDAVASDSFITISENLCVKRCCITSLDSFPNARAFRYFVQVRNNQMFGP